MRFQSNPIIKIQKAEIMKLSEAPTFPPIRKGLKVQTPMGSGKIAYGQQNIGGWTRASVVLDGRRNDIHYIGTMFLAEEIEVSEEW